MIKFNWKLNGAYFQENFIPYSSKALKTLRNSENYNDSDNIFLDVGIDFSNNPNVIDEKLLSDILIEILSVCKLYAISKKESVSEELRNLYNQMFNYETLVQIYIDLAKIDISNLLEVSKTVSDRSLERMFYKYVVNILEVVDMYNIYNIEDKEQKLKQLNLDYQVLIRSFSRDKLEELNGWMNRLLTTNDYSEKELRKIRSTVWKLLTKIPKKISLYNEWRYKVIKESVKNSKLNTYFSKNECLLMGISIDLYESNLNSFIYMIKNRMEEFQQSLLSVDDILGDTTLIKDKLMIFADFFNSRESIMDKKGNIIVGKNLIKKYQTEQGCFGIMEVDGGDNYFALSSRDDYMGSVHNVVMLKSNMKFLANEINRVMFSNSYKWATLSDSTKRYTTFTCSPDKKNIKIMPVAIELGADTEVSHADSIGLNYGCCERKMQSACVDSVSNKIFYTRWAPCKQCLPALLTEMGNIRIFSLYTNFDDFKNSKCSYGECEISNTIQKK